MESQYELVKNLIVASHTEEALLCIEDSDVEIVLLQERYRNGFKQYHTGLIELEEWQNIKKQINSALLQVLNNPKINPKIKTKSILSNKKNVFEFVIKVFVVYAPADYKYINNIKSYLSDNNIKIEFDDTIFMPGNDIDKFYQEQIDSSDLVLLILSGDSLMLSSILNYVKYAFKSGVRLLPLCLDYNIFSLEYYIEALTKLESKIGDCQTKIQDVLSKALDVYPFTDELERLRDIKSLLPKTLESLRSTLIVDISNSKFEEGMSKVSSTILRINEFKKSNIEYKVAAKSVESLRSEKNNVKTLDTLDKNTIYFSYAWGDQFEVKESREELVDKLYKSLVEDGYPLKRDKMDLGYKGLISDFMKEIGQGNLIIIAISDKYLRSPYCMFEIYEVWRNSSFEKNRFIEKIFPIVVERIKLDDPLILDNYLEYWERQEESWKNLVQKRTPKLGGEHFLMYDRVRKISHNFSNIASFIQDMNSLNKELISENNFQVIKELIDMKIE